MRAAGAMRRQRSVVSGNPPEADSPRSRLPHRLLSQGAALLLRLSQVIQQLLRWITIRRPAKGLLSAANGLARVGADDPVRGASIVLASREQGLQFDTLRAAKRAVAAWPLA